MYRPMQYRVDDPDILHQFVMTYPFGMLVTTVEGGEWPLITHVPFVWRHPSESVWGHLARANPHVHHLDGRPAVAVFEGPHGYISSDWYGMEPSVPTWDYQAVHLMGTVRVVDDVECMDLLRTTLKVFDPQLPLNHHVHEDAYQHYRQAIVGFEFRVEKMEGQFKLSQNRTRDERRRVIAALEERGGLFDMELARLIGKTL